MKSIYKVLRKVNKRKCQPWMEDSPKGKRRENDPFGSPRYFGDRPSEGYWPCLVGTTKISLLDGRDISLRELYENGETNFYVYSLDKNVGVIPCIAYGVVLTKKGAEVLKITLDNGESFKCTPDHLIMMRDGSYKRADELSVEDSLMPLYRKPDRVGESFYEVIYDPILSYEVMTYLKVAEFWYGDVRDFIVHHRNFNPQDCRPSNLVLCDKDTHTRIHCIKNPKFRETMKQAMEKMWQDPEKRKKVGETIKMLWKDKSYCEKTLVSRSKFKLGETMRKLWSDSLFREKTLSHRNYDKKYRQKCSESRKKFYRDHPEAREKIRQSIIASYTRNHKIFSIERSERQDVFDVVNVDPNHNFALSCGIFVHNSVQWMPKGQENKS